MIFVFKYLDVSVTKLKSTKADDTIGPLIDKPVLRKRSWIAVEKCIMADSPYEANRIFKEQAGDAVPVMRIFTGAPLHKKNRR